jgi:DNA-binding MarR family transcriptional regulator
MNEKAPASRDGKSRADAALLLDNQLCFALYSASAAVTRAYRPLLEPLDLTYPQYIVMLVLWDRSPLSVGELGTVLGHDSATLTPLLKRLEANGLVSRRRDPADERRVLVAPTPAGEALKEKARGVPAALRCQLPLSDTEFLELRKTLKRLAAELNEPDPAPAR